MKTLKFLFILVLCYSLGACTNKQNQSDVTQTGQHIGNNADSTTVDGPKGNPSNH